MTGLNPCQPCGAHFDHAACVEKVSGMTTDIFYSFLRVYGVEDDCIERHIGAKNGANLPLTVPQARLFANLSQIAHGHMKDKPYSENVVAANMRKHMTNFVSALPAPPSLETKAA